MSKGRNKGCGKCQEGRGTEVRGREEGKRMGEERWVGITEREEGKWNGGKGKEVGKEGGNRNGERKIVPHIELLPRPLNHMHNPAK